MRDWVNILGGLAIFFAGLLWLAGGGGVVALLVMLGGGYGASQASIRRNRRLADEHQRQRIDALESRQLEQRDVMQRRIAGQCGHPVAEGAAFCSTCGAPAADSEK